MSKNGLQLTMISVLVLLLAVLAAAGLAALTPAVAVQAGPGGTDSEPLVADGRLPGYEDQPGNENPDAFYYTVGSLITFNRPTAPGKVMLENIPGNRYDMRVTFELESTGQVVYTSPVLQSNQYLEEDYLDEELEKGQYDAVAVIAALDPDTGEQVAGFSENITIVVKNKLF